MVKKTLWMCSFCTILILTISGCGATDQQVESQSASLSEEQGTAESADDPPSDLSDLPMVIRGKGQGTYGDATFNRLSPFVNAGLAPEIGTRGSTHLYTRVEELVDMSWQSATEEELEAGEVSIPENLEADTYITKPEVILSKNQSETVLAVGYGGAISNTGHLAYAELEDSQGLTAYGQVAASLVVSDNDGANPQTWADVGAWLPVAWIDTNLLAYDLGDGISRPLQLHVFSGPEESVVLDGWLVGILPNKVLVLGNRAADNPGASWLSTYHVRTRTEIDRIDIDRFLDNALGAVTPNGTVFAGSNGSLLSTRVLGNGKFKEQSVAEVAANFAEGSDAPPMVDAMVPEPGNTVLAIFWSESDSSRAEVQRCDTRSCVLIGTTEMTPDLSFLYELAS